MLCHAAKTARSTSIVSGGSGGLVGAGWLLFTRAGSTLSPAKIHSHIVNPHDPPVYPRAEDLVGKSTPPQPRWAKIDQEGRSYGVGGRKRARAFVYIKPGNGTMMVNGIPHTEYFPRMWHRGHMLEPFMVTQSLTKFDVYCNTQGGGVSGQAQAIRHGIARALQNYNPLFRPRLKSAKLLIRDHRKVERKHFGRKKARKSHQWVKR